VKCPETGGKGRAFYSSGVTEARRQQSVGGAGGAALSALSDSIQDLLMNSADVSQDVSSRRSTRIAG
jgi:hypothetical protein